MTGGEAVIRSLVDHDVSVVFGIPGVHNLAVYEALCDVPGIRHIGARHEQGASFMADGYARASGRAGVCLCTSGPAVLNAVPGLGTALSDSSPVLCVASQIPSAGIGQDKGYLHECRDQLACLRPVTKWCTRADTVAEIPGIMREAFAQMLNGRRGPVAVEIPCDIMDAADEVEPVEPAVLMRTEPQPEQIQQAVDLLATARRPVIWAGGGVINSDAGDELLAFAEQLQAPVFTTVLGKGTISGDHPLCAGTVIQHPAAREYVVGCDVMVAVGTRFNEDESNGWSVRLPDSLVHIDIDPAEINRNYPCTVGVVGDARQCLRQLNTKLAPLERQSDSDRIAEIAQLRLVILEDCRELAPAGVEFVETIQAALPRDTVLVNDLAVGAYWCRRLLEQYEPRSNVYPWGFCTLGFGVPAAIGAKLAQPLRPTVLLSGDGGFQFNLQELAVAVQFDVPIVIVLLNDGGYGALEPQQQMRYGRSSGADLENPDFVALAAAYGIEGCRVDSIAALGPAITEAIESGQARLIELPIQLPPQIMESAARAMFLAGLNDSKH